MARIELPEIFQSGMMFQRDKVIKIWGSGKDVTSIRVRLGEDSITVKVEDDGFYCELPPQKAAVKQTLYITVEEEEKPEVTITDISIGDIYIAAGQSNMEYFLRYDAHFNDVKKWERNDAIHMFNCKRIAYSGQERDFPDSGSWFLEHDYQWDTFSAPGYAFARYLQPILEVPIGIIGCNWGGTSASAWMPSSSFDKEPLRVYKDEYEEAVASMTKEELERKSQEGWAFEDLYEHQIAWRSVMYGLNVPDQKEWVEKNANNPVIPFGPYHHNRPSGLYEQMVKKLAPFSVKGVLWYQGESDSDHANLYDKLFKELIRSWRELWQEELPFLFVQLAPFGKWRNCFGTNYPIIRECQEKIAKNVPNTGMVSIMDLGMYEDIHPKQKIEIGERLALLARGKIYGEDLLCESPESFTAKRNGNQIVLSFLNTGKTLYMKGDTINSLFVRQGDKDRVIKEIKIDTKITLSFEELTQEPVEIRFAQEPYCEVNVFNEAGLPVKPFLLHVI